MVNDVIKKIIVCNFAIVGWLLWAFVISVAILAGGDLGQVTLTWNHMNEMWIEFYAVIMVIVVIIISSIGIIRNKTHDTKEMD